MNHAAHPDADLLSAFVERALGKRERAAVTEHLAACGECRDLLSLVAGESAPVEMPKHVRWPAWSAAGVALAACCALVYLSIPRTQPLHLPVARTMAAPPVSQPPPQPPPTLNPVRKATRVSAAPPVVQTKKKEAVVAPAETAAPPANSVAVNGNAFQPSEAPFVSASPVMQSFRQSAAAMVAPHPLRWSISAAEELERSLDGGRTWETVRVGMGRFRAVAVAGAQVWAGGEDGVLFHSPDKGAHWDRVTVADGERKLTGSVMSIRVEAGTIDLATSSGERWSSSDSGARWK